jgi:hypothetical protein
MASSSNNFADTLNANFKIVYADKIENLIPDGVKLLNQWVQLHLVVLRLLRSLWAWYQEMVQT